MTIANCAAFIATFAYLTKDAYVTDCIIDHVMLTPFLDRNTSLDIAYALEHLAFAALPHYWGSSIVDGKMPSETRVEGTIDWLMGVWTY